MVLLFLVLISRIILPTFERELLKGKESTIHSLTDTAWSIVAYYHDEERSGRLSRAEAQRQACAQLRTARYGPEMKDYFWIASDDRHVVMHPYLQEIEGRSPDEISDRALARNVAEVQQQIARSGDGFIDYSWRHQDNSERQTPKRAYVKTFAPWNWHIGTGVYLEDVAAETADLRNCLLGYLGTIFAVVTALSYVTIRQNTRMEIAREQAEIALRDNETRLQTVLNTLQAGVVIVDANTHEILDVNATALQMIGARHEDVIGRICHQYICPAAREHCPITDLKQPIEKANKILLRADGTRLQIMKTVIPTNLNGRQVLLESFVDISAHVAAEEQLQQHVKELSDAKRRLEVLVSNITGRETRMVELKQEVNVLLEQLGQSPRYETPEKVARLLEAQALGRES